MIVLDEKHVTEHLAEIGELLADLAAAKAEVERLIEGYRLANEERKNLRDALSHGNEDLATARANLEEALRLGDAMAEWTPARLGESAQWRAFRKRIEEGTK